MPTMTPPTSSPEPVAGRMNLYWSPRSPFVRRVMVTLHELGLATDVHRIDAVVAMTGCNDGVMRANPLNKIPTLVLADGSVLTDSTLICEHLASDSALAPADRTTRLQALRWHGIGHGLTDLLVLWRNERLRPAAQQSPEVLAAWDAKSVATLAMLDGDAASLGGTPVTLGHIAIACALGYLDFRFAERNWRTEAPRLAQWFAAFNQRESMQQTMPPMQA